MKTYDLRGKKTIITNTLFYMIMNSILQLLFITIGILMIAVLYKTIELDEPILTIFALLRAVIYFSGHGSISVSYYQLQVQASSAYRACIVTCSSSSSCLWYSHYHSFTPFRSTCCITLLQVVTQIITASRKLYTQYFKY